MSKQIEPPYKPEVKDDLAYFDQKLVNQSDNEIMESVVPAQSKALIQKGQHNFDGFSS